MARRSPDISTDLFALTEQKDTITQARKDRNKAATFYFHPEVLSRLEGAWLDLRRHTSSPVSKSAIVEAALVTALEDLERNGPESEFVRMLW